MHVLFMCPHGAAKSVIATAMLRARASRHGLDLTAANAGTDPDDELNPIALTALRARGLDYEEAPRLVTTDDIENASVVVSFGCPVHRLPVTPRLYVDWSDAPDASADVDGLISFIDERLADLIGHEAQ